MMKSLLLKKFFKQNQNNMNKSQKNCKNKHKMVTEIYLKKRKDKKTKTKNPKEIDIKHVWRRQTKTKQILKNVL